MKKVKAILAAAAISLLALTPGGAHAAHNSYTNGYYTYTYTWHPTGYGRGYYTYTYIWHPYTYTAPAPIYNTTPRAATGGVYDAIATAAARWGVNYYWLLRVATCESGLNPGAYNPSGASGLFQFMPSTYWLYAPRIGETRSYWDAYGAANVAAYMFSQGQAYQWVCR